MSGGAGDTSSGSWLWEGHTPKEAAECSYREHPGNGQHLCGCGVGDSTADKETPFFQKPAELLTGAVSKLDGQRSVGDTLTEAFAADAGIVQNININIVSLQQKQTVTENAYIEIRRMIDGFHNPERTN